LTFTTLLALVQMLTIALTVFSAFPVFKTFRYRLKFKGNGWLLMRDVNHIRATELLHLFVLDRGLLPAKQINDPLQQWLAACAEQLEQSTDITLQELFARCSA
jgi:hypothetical protein